ncbi:uncharacterized protein DUF222 [Georgenia soli]|uniref:Uncharacterized protein DUF222 n=1 Tax=Georgenia soli TaxID=638953 RepID=A0A2A9EGN6_9MICO|nr:HNH endonuclease signature motif containing protein [Georgenia soli]PFG38003.1 uncharacterized protein DUF222 [Georgenia soli]
MAVGTAAESEVTGGPVALLRAVRHAVGTLRAQADAAGARAWRHTEREDVIGTLDAVIRDLTVYRGRVLLAHKEDGRWGSARDRDFVDWRARTTGAGRGSASGEITVAAGLDAMPEVARAVDAGALDIEHARALARLREGASDEVKKALDSGVAADLVEHAKSKKLSAPELAKEARRRAATIDAQAAQETFDATWRRRSVTFGRSAGGGRSGRWQLDDVGGVLVETALDAVAGTVAADDSRSREQRHADALVTLASRTLQVGADLNGAQVRPHVALVVDEETWAASRAHGGKVDDATARKVDDVQGAGAAFGLLPDGTAADVRAVEDSAVCGVSGRPAGVPRLPDVEPAELEDGTIVPLRELLRLLCDCEVTRVVMTAESVPLDVGLTQRTYTRELRRAVTTRDRTCVWPGCTIRAAWSEVHHIVWYSRGGPTSVGNAATLCTYHHHVVHNDNVRLVPLTDGFAFYRADGSLIGTRRRPPRGPRKAAADKERRSPSPPPGAAELVAAWNTVGASEGATSPELPDMRPAGPRAASPTGSSDPPGSLSPPGSSAVPGTSSPPGSSAVPGTSSPPGSSAVPGASCPAASSAVQSTSLPPDTGTAKLEPQQPQRPRASVPAGRSHHEPLWNDGDLPAQSAEPPF